MQACEKAVQDNLKKVSVAQKASELATQTLADFNRTLPAMIDALYLGCINRVVGKEAIEQAREKELQLLAKRQEHQNECQQRQDELSNCQSMLDHSKEALKKEQLKYEGLQILVKELRKKNNINQERQYNKMMDEFAILKFNVK
jgi:hypothetical protein